MVSKLALAGLLVLAATAAALRSSTQASLRADAGNALSFESRLRAAIDAEFAEMETHPFTTVLNLLAAIEAEIAADRSSAESKHIAFQGQCSVDRGASDVAIAQAQSQLASVQNRISQLDQDINAAQGAISTLEQSIPADQATKQDLQNTLSTESDARDAEHQTFLGNLHDTNEVIDAINEMITLARNGLTERAFTDEDGKALLALKEKISKHGFNSKNAILMMELNAAVDMHAMKFLSGHSNKRTRIHEKTLEELVSAEHLSEEGNKASLIELLEELLVRIALHKSDIISADQLAGQAWDARRQSLEASIESLATKIDNDTAELGRQRNALSTAQADLEAAKQAEINAQNELSSQLNYRNALDTKCNNEEVTHADNIKALDDELEVVRKLREMTNQKLLAASAAIKDAASGAKIQWATGEWSSCSAECGTGYRTRRVMCPGGQDDACFADAVPTLVEECNTHVCPRDCVVSQFGSWSQCSAPCSGGIQTRSRDVVVEAAGNGQACPALQEEQECNTQQCQWEYSSSFEALSCSAVCGGGSKDRQAQCPVEGKCAGTPDTHQDCGTNECHDWSIGAWSTCAKSGASCSQTRSVTCAGGEAYCLPKAAKPAETQACECPAENVGSCLNNPKWRQCWQNCGASWGNADFTDNRAVVDTPITLQDLREKYPRNMRFRAWEVSSMPEHYRCCSNVHNHPGAQYIYYSTTPEPLNFQNSAYINGGTTATWCHGPQSCPGNFDTDSQRSLMLMVVADTNHNGCYDYNF